MTILTTLMTASALVILLFGIYLLLFPRPTGRLNQAWMKGGVALQLLLFAFGIVGLVVMGAGEVMAADEAVAGVREISLGHGLAIIGVGLPTGMATIGAGFAVSSVGSASLAVITEKPEMFGRTLIYLGLAEGIAIYGLVVSILLLGEL
jgi:V/A-type H+-transporting ATPase subunit K